MRRIHREIADVKKEDLGSITLAPTHDNLYRWKGTIPGPQGSPYEGGVFNVDIHLGPDYPFSAPKVSFSTRIYHMNISDKGGICIDILKQNWSPALSLFKVMLSLSSLLTDPNPQDPLVPSIATEYMRNRIQHDSTARRWTELYARPPPLPAPAGFPPSSRSKGKGKAQTAQSSTSTQRVGSSTSGSTMARLFPPPVTNDDPDVEIVSIPSTAVAGRKRRREVVTIDLAENEGRIRRKPSHRSATPDVCRQADVIIIDD